MKKGRELGDIGEPENTPEDLVAQKEVKALQAQAVENVLNSAGRYNGKSNSELKEVDKAISKAVMVGEDGEVLIDEAGNPVFKASIEWKTYGGQIMAIWTCCKSLLEEGLVPPEETDGVFELMYKLSEIHKDTNKEYLAVLPINYFVGSCHIMNLALRIGVFKGDEKLHMAIEKLTIFFAERIDSYHKVKAHEEYIDNENEPVLLTNDLKAKAQISQQVKRTIGNLKVIDGDRY